MFYALFGADAGKFAISPTGELSFLAIPDFELAGDANSDNVYEVTVAASEAAGASAFGLVPDTRDLRITVTDVAEGPNVVTGTAASDFLIGLAGPDFISGLGGDDQIMLGAGDDRAYGGEGNDDISPGAGNDIIYGEGGENSVSYADAAGGIWVDFDLRTVMETEGGRSLLAPAGAEFVSTDFIFDIWAVEGSAFDDRFYGSAATEGFAPGAGNDIVYGSSGDVLAYFNALGGVWIDAESRYVMEAEAGSDFRNGTAGVTVASTDIVIGFDNFIGSAFDDRFYGSDRMEFFFAAGGDDIAYGGGGFDIIAYGNAMGAVYIDLSQRYANEMSSVAGTDPVAVDLIYGFEGADGSDFGDRLFGDGGNNGLGGGDGDDIIYGGGGSDVISGGEGSDVLSGETGDDVIKGGAGDDLLIGGLGNDELIGGTGADRFIFNAAYDSAFGADTITDLVLSEGDLLDLRGHSLSYGDLVFTNVVGGVEISAAALGVGNTITVLGITGAIDEAHIFL